MKISMIIPVHNAENTLKTCVESITSQVPSGLEVLLIENGSTDRSWDICREIAEADNRVFCIQTDEKGVSAARNAGLRRATGQIIGFADADDTLQENILPRIREVFSQHSECDAISCGFSKVYPDGKVQQYCIRENKIISFHTMIRDVLCDHNISGYLWNKYWRADILKDIWFREDLSHSEDTHFVVNALFSHPEKTVFLLTDVGYHYYQQPDSVTAQAAKSFDEEGRCKLIAGAYAITQDFSLEKALQLLVERLIFSMASSQYLRFQKELLPKQRENLQMEMRKHLWSYLRTAYTAPSQSAKRLLRLMLSRRNKTGACGE